MANASDYLRNEIGTKYLNLGAGSSLPASLHVGAFTASLAADGTNLGTEISGSGYARASVSASSFTESPNGTFTSNAQIAFPTASGSWGTIVSIGLFDAATSGNLLVFDDLASSAAVTTGIVLTIPASSLVVTIA